MASGIYRIVNTTNGKSYIGSSVNMANRWRQHRQLLRLGKHHSQHLQNAWKKYGESSFRFDIVETTNDLISREQWHIDNFRPEYNANVIVSSSFMLGKRHDEQTKLKMKTNNRSGDPSVREKISNTIRKSFEMGRIVRHSLATRALMAKKASGRIQSVSTKEKLGQVRRTYYANGGNKLTGVTNPASKLSPKAVMEIRAQWFYKTQRELAKQYGVSQGCIHKIVTRKTWTALEA